MQRNMVLVFPTLVAEHQLITRLRRTIGINKTIPNIIHRQRRRMHQIIRIETIVA